MPRGKTAKGTCNYCGVEISKGGVTKHLATCPQRQKAIQEAEHKRRASETLYHLRVQATESSEFWLDLEMRGSATLKDLDSYLRAIWLECCGHMSRFSVGGWGAPEIPKVRTAEQIFRPGIQLTHIYDFGTESVTYIKMVGAREGKPTTTHPIALLARNQMPEAKCIECGQPATMLCMECLIEHDVFGALCDEHAQDHPHDNYGEPMGLYNSPRVGMCGYDGPAEPPY